MPLGISLNVQDLLDTAARFQRFASDAPALIARAMDEENLNTVSHILETKLTAAGPQFLNVRTGRLRRSIRATDAVISGNVVKSLIGSNVSYAAAQEYGTAPYKIVARTGKALRFAPKGGGFIFRRSVNHPGLRARRPIGTGVDECAANYGPRIAGLITRELLPA